MSLNTWQETLWAVEVSGPAINTQTTSNTLLGNSSLAGPGQPILPANFFNFVGKALHFRLGGQCTQNLTATTLQLNVLFNGVSVFATQAMSVNVTTQIVNAVWDLDLQLTARAIGQAANLFGLGTFTCVNFSNAQGCHLFIPQVGPTTGTAFDGTVAINVDIRATWSVSAANNNIQLLGGIMEAMN